MRQTIFYTLLAALFLAACSSEEENGGVPMIEVKTIDFETAPVDKGVISAATAAAEGADFSGTVYTEDVAEFQGYMAEGDKYPTGFAISNRTDMVNYRETNRYSLYTYKPLYETPVYAVGFYAPATTEEEIAGGAAPRPARVPTINFSEPVSIFSCHVTNTTLAYKYWTGSDMIYNPGGQVTADCKLLIQGSLEGKPTKSVEWPLAVKADNLVVDQWLSVDLSKLGRIDKLTFFVRSKDEHVVKSFCLDNITYYKY